MWAWCLWGLWRQENIQDKVDWEVWLIGLCEKITSCMSCYNYCITPCMSYCIIILSTSFQDSGYTRECFDVIIDTDTFFSPMRVFSIISSASLTLTGATIPQLHEILIFWRQQCAFRWSWTEKARPGKVFSRGAAGEVPSVGEVTGDEAGREPGQPTTTELLGPQPYLTVHEAHHTTWAAPQQPITTTTTNHWENRPYNLHSPYRGQKSSNWETFSNGYCFSNWCHLQCYGIFVIQGAGPLYLIYLGGKVESERKGQSRPWKSPLGGLLWKSAPS